MLPWTIAFGMLLTNLLESQPHHTHQEFSLGGGNMSHRDILWQADR